MEDVSRRRFIAAAGAAGALVATGAARVRASAGPSPHARVQRNQIDHIVVVCMENRSFDHYLGWVPKANGRQAGLAYPDQTGQLVPTWHLDTRQGCGYADPDHSYKGGHQQLGTYNPNTGQYSMDGFLQGDNDRFAVGYYERGDLPFYDQLVSQATVCDNYFCSFLGPTYPNRIYTHAATTDRSENTSTTSTLPTIWDRLAAAGVPATYYFSDLPVLALWGDKYPSISKPVDSFLARAATGTLDPYSYLDPFFLGEGQGGSNDDHPHADILRGQAFLSQVVKAVVEGPAWSSTVLVITYDEWGGFFEHVSPPTLPDQPGPLEGKDHAVLADANLSGFRVPALVVSPFAPARVEHRQLDHTSILKMVEWRFGLAPLTPRDTAAVGLERLLSAQPGPTPHIDLVTDPGPHICTESLGLPGVMGPASVDDTWAPLASLNAVRSFG